VPASSAPTGAVIVELAGPPGYYVPEDLTARAGDVVFLLSNTSPGTHNLSIGQAPLEFAGERVTNVALAASGRVRPGTSATFAVDQLPSGTYSIWCAIDNHAAEGMVGTLTVTP
jgi:plastocyanin